MKKNKAFTLIELLAVIIILAIIALIATPIIINVVEESKETARRSSISGYADGVRYAVYSNDYIYTGKLSEVTKEWAESNVEVSGDKVDCEEVKFSDSFETVLHKCRVGKSIKEYCYAGGKTYEDCGDAEYQNIYDSFTLAGVLKKQYNESNTVGLLKDETGYYYKGTKEEVSNNFVWFAGHLWRVISIDNDNNLTMITQQPITSIQPASAVWTTQEEYEASYINHWLNSEEDGVFYKSLEQADKDKILNNTFNVGNHTNVSEITTSQKVGLLDETQYTKVGGSSSFLNIKNYWWLGNRYGSSNVRGVYISGALLYKSPSNAYGIRPVVKISNLTFAYGKGTLGDPYRENSKTTNTSNIKVGEYISIPTNGTDCGSDNRCLFRVVSKDNNAIKVTLNGLLPSESAFDSNKNITYASENIIDTIVMGFANTIDSKYRYTGSSTIFGIGAYVSGVNYKAVQDTTYVGNVGLPVVGEMFTSNDIDMGSTKRFVNINTIENPSVSNYYWTMNANLSSSVRYIDQYGVLPSNNPSNAKGVRPVLFLNNNLNFISGEGTAENPFILE